VKREASLTTPEEEIKRAEVPEHTEPRLGDESRHANEQYTLVRREGALPADDVVIPDTEIMYNKAENSNICDLYEVGDLRAEKGSLPFVHGVEIAGPKGEVVRFRSVFDDSGVVAFGHSPGHMTIT
jgi:hypothetical protein